MLDFGPWGRSNGLAVVTASTPAYSVASASGIGSQGSTSDSLTQRRDRLNVIGADALQEA